MDFTAHYPSPLGTMTMAAEDDAIVGLWFDGQRHFADVLATDPRERPDLPVFDDLRRWLDSYFGGQQPRLSPPLRLRGSSFRRHVWEALMTIPYGQTATYGDIGRRTGCLSAQAIGGAVGHNPIAILVPCHRVVAADGSLGGYAAGIERKARLLQAETLHLSSPHTEDTLPSLPPTSDTHPCN